VNFTFIKRNAGGFGQGCQRRLQILRRNPGIGLVGREASLCSFITSIVACARKGVE